ncbi:MAG: C40 family peptidase [Prevotella sp.]|jgi:cell wall-associated NlpC family hydrolase|nr:C40 family peptidase [Prevotella sp.]
MRISPKSLRLSTLLLLFSVATMSVSATPQGKQKPNKKKTVAGSVAPKSIKVVQSTNRVEVTTDDGYQFLLPKYEKIFEDQHPAFPISNKLLTDAGIDLTPSLELMKEKMLEQKEMQELSSRLGISITDPVHLDLYREAADWLGTRYRRGGMSRNAVDCSGFTNIIYKNVYGMQLDRVSTAIAKNVKETISKDDLEPGDMVFFSTFKKKYINHVGVYIGDGKFIHASIKHGVIVSSLAEGYYSKAWRKGGRNL